MYTADVRAATIREIEELVIVKALSADVSMTKKYEPPILVYIKTAHVQVIHK